MNSLTSSIIIFICSIRATIWTNKIILFCIHHYRTTFSNMCAFWVNVFFIFTCLTFVNLCWTFPILVNKIVNYQKIKYLTVWDKYNVKPNNEDLYYSLAAYLNSDHRLKNHHDPFSRILPLCQQGQQEWHHALWERNLSICSKNAHFLLLPFPDFFVLSFSDLYFCLIFFILFTTSFNVKSANLSPVTDPTKCIEYKHLNTKLSIELINTSSNFNNSNLQFSVVRKTLRSSAVNIACSCDPSPMRLKLQSHYIIQNMKNY